MEEDTTYVPNAMIPYNKHTIEEDDIQAVVDVLRENRFLTTGPKISEFEEALVHLSGEPSNHAIVCNSGTAALHLAMYAIDIQPDDEVIVPAISFSATANCVLYQKGKPVFCDVDRDTLNIDLDKIEALITRNTKAIITVDYGGNPIDYEKLDKIIRDRGTPIYIISDSAHSVGLEGVGENKYTDMTCYSFHAIKNLASGEGGCVLTKDIKLADRMRRFRTHGITISYPDRKSHEYDIIDIGFNYRITDIQCALGINQVKKVKRFIQRRQEIAKIYDLFFNQISINSLLSPLKVVDKSAYHLYVIKLNLEMLNCDRDMIFNELRSLNIGVNVNYKPIYLLTAYQNLGKHTNLMNPLTTHKGLCPIAEGVYNEIISLPIFPELSYQDQMYIIRTISEVLTNHKIQKQN